MSSELSPSSAACGSPWRLPLPAWSWRHSDSTDGPYRMAMYSITPTRTAMMMYSSVKLELAVPGTAAEPPPSPPELGSGGDGGEDMVTNAAKNTTTRSCRLRRFQGHGNVCHWLKMALGPPKVPSLQGN
ncbi:hypothetical protein E2562_007798 [Oryza meyeriana var. granulata]|uniref:Uncharacterized protein n=1 Tax=Oryza meyeriana var. granulata TaxID=110450 RepID=A0A6G1F4Z7_9ORYZ|nr:hypothetical protein E2562_007798 [Oryza meyeriana var. granulata]